MFQKIRTIFAIPELRQKVLLTLFLLAIYRVGWQVPLPIVNTAEMKRVSDQGAGQGGLSDVFNQVAIFSASQLNVVTIFGLGIMPYISASIIFQLLGSVWEPLEKLRKEGESGQKKINEYTRYLTVFICLIQTWGYVKYYLLSNNGKLVDPNFYDPVTQSVPFGWILVTILTMTAGTIFLMWLGEQIDEFGIGNGISLLIMAGILARMPAAANDMLKVTHLELGSSGGQKGIEVLIGLVVLFVGVVAGVVYIDRAQRRIPTQHAKHVRGRRVFGGTREYLPLRVNQSGVMPIIFASSLLLFPQMLFKWAESVTAATNGQQSMWHNIWEGLEQALARGSSFTYNVLYIVLIYFFCYFWTAITFNPKEMADNMKDHGTFIPGYRPGRRTADHLERVMVRITYVGAGYLAIVAITPTIVGSLMGVPPNVSSFFGGTGLLIIVSVAFDLVQQIDSHLIMRNYKGLLE
jgi:preprotein translocase subunit SecY